MRIVVASLLFVLVSSCDGTHSQAQQQPAVRLPEPSPTAQVDASRRNAITNSVERVSPSVVTVQTEAVERVPIDVFEQFFGGRSGQRSTAGLGSGFIIRPDGYILTNEHVVRGAQKIHVALRDGTRYAATVVGRDSLNDLAVLKAESAKNLPVAPLGTSDNLMIGEWAIAIGNPYGFVLANTEPSVTVGVVSGVGRNLMSSPDQSGTVYVDMIQTDAAINPGNSGGPLVNASGEVIGVNSSIYTPSGGSVGLGFAIPINRARRVAEDLIAHGSVRQPWIGVKPAVVAATDFDANATQGALVASVTPGSPAAQVGIRRGDVIVQAGNRVLHNSYDWEAERLELRVGETVPLTLKRGSSEVKVNVRVADLPEVNAPRVTVLREIELVTLTPAIAAERNLKSTSGAYVRSVSQRVSDQIGIQSGDVIVQINQTRISTAEDAANALNGGRGMVEMLVERQGQLYRTEFVTQ